MRDSRKVPRGCLTVLTLDYDIPYTRFKDSLLEEWLTQRVEKMDGYMMCRPSTSGNTHCSICFDDRSLTEEERLILMLLFLDDPYRGLYNLQRLLRMGRLEDRLYSFKTKLLVGYKI